MDPDTALSDIRALVADIRATVDGQNGLDPNGPDIGELGNDLADAVDNLDNWLGKGGFLPKAWQR